ncbi:choice-of-anchor J domain-containing protein [uncultured Algibacter sp.]|uniref:choice-of-anchor J domain-containing protein n=1 Tax=uncultured Algibacter sp. TaxID=298659 RepID=UPI00261F80E0|nr:choice-of-anchor J domain-containing protein [uncultured Algibacter sp.]
MKKIIYIFMILTVSLVSCESSLEDTYDELGLDNTVVGDETITLSDDDYEEIGVANSFFESIDDAKELIPDFLTVRYPVWGKGSSVLVNYEIEFGTDLPEIMGLTNATVYQLGLADYATTGNQGAAFYPDIDSDDFLPEILEDAITMAEEGDMVLARYDQFFNEPEIGLANIYQASFPTNYDDFENIDVLGDQGWTVGSANVQGSGFQSGAFANEDWLISPEIDLVGQTDLKFQINQEIDLFGSPIDLFDIIVSTDYVTGTDPMAASWTALDFDKTAYGSLTLSPDLDFSAYDGETIHVAFKYTSTDDVSPRWRIESFAIKTIGVEGEVDNKGAYYTYDGSRWEEAENVFYLSKSDYDAMGEDSGRPGRFNNFSNSVAPEDYLPRFLSRTSPYDFAQEEDEVLVIYRFFNGSTVLRGNSYSVVNGEWTPHQVQLQFGHDGNKWVPDNTIKYTMGRPDYDLIIAALSAKYPDATSSMDNFGNMDRRAGNSAQWTDEMVLEAITVILDGINPTAGEAQKYIVTIDVFNGSRTTEDFAVIKENGIWVYQ